MRRAVAFIALVCALPSLSSAATAASAEAATYRLQTQDLFPEREDVDLAVRLEGTAYWRLDPAALAPGAALDRDLTPVQGPLSVELHYRMRRACCPEQFVQGVQPLHDLLPLGLLELRDVAVGDRVAVLRLEGTLRARAETEGPGEATLAPGAWEGWAPLALTVEAAPDARPGERVVVAVHTRYEVRIDVRLDDPAGLLASQAAPPATPGEPPLERAFPVAGAASAAARPVPGAPLLLALLLGLALSRSRRGP